MKRSEIVFGLLRIPMDIVAALAALLLSYRLREANIDLIPSIQLLEPSPSLPSLNFYISDFVIPWLIVFIVIVALMRLYALVTTVSSWNEMGRIFFAGLIWVALVTAWYFLIQKQLFFSRILLLHSFFFVVIFVMLGRSAVVILQRAFLKIKVGVRVVVSVGEHSIARSAKEILKNDIHYAYLGHVPDLHHLKIIMTKYHVDLVLQTDPTPESKQTVSLIDYCRSNHIGYAFLPPVFADVPHQLRVNRLGLIPILAFQPTPLDGWGRVTKRIFDIVGSSFLLIVLSPILILIAAAIYVESGRPIFYVSKRIGDGGKREIFVLKFRSMIKNADELKAKLMKKNEREDGPLFKIKNDPRVTFVGKIIRRFDLDELPQLFNVLIGQMSLVGPRPHLPEEVSKYTSYQKRVFTVKPGVTGLAQVSGRSNLKFAEEMRLDLQYVEEWSVHLDLWILWRTGWVVLAREDN